MQIISTLCYNNFVHFFHNDYLFIIYYYFSEKDLSDLGEYKLCP